MERQLVSTYKRKFEDFAVQHGFGADPVSVTQVLSNPARENLKPLCHADIQEDFYMPDDLPYPPKMRRWLELRIAFHDKRTELRALQAELKRFPKPKSATSCWSGCCTF